MANKDEPTVYVAIESGAAQDAKTKEVYTFRRGQTRVRAGHPLLKMVPDYFVPAEQGALEVEQATSAPGEKRG